MRQATFALLACTLVAQVNDLERARQLLTSGHAAAAAAIYRELAKADARNPELLLNLSIAEYKAGQFGEAAASASAALALKPDLASARLFLGASYLELREFDKAIEPLERVVAANPRERNAQLMLGEAFLGAGRAAPAAEHLRTAAQLLPANPRVWYALGKALESLSRKDEAVDAFKRLSELPPSVESHIHAAEVNDADHRWRDSVAEWKEAVRLSPDNGRARIGLAWALFRARDYEDAKQTLQTLVQEGSDGGVLFLYGAALLNEQRPADALPYLTKAVERDPKLLPARAALGQALLQTGKPAEAIPLLQDGLAVDEDGSTHFQLFRAYQLTNRAADAKKALAAYQRFRESLPSPP